MGWFKTIQGDSFQGTLNVKRGVLLRAREYFVWPTLRMLKWFLDGVVADKDVCKCEGCQECESGVKKDKLGVL